MSDLTVTQTATLTGLSKSTIRRYIRNGWIKTTKDADGQHFISEGEIAKLPKPYRKHGQPTPVETRPLSADAQAFLLGIQKELDNPAMQERLAQATLEAIRQGFQRISPKSYSRS